MLAPKSNDKRRSAARSLDNSRHSCWQCLMFPSRLLRMTSGLTPQPEEEPTQVEIRSRGDAHVWQLASPRRLSQAVRGPLKLAIDGRRAAGPRRHVPGLQCSSAQLSENRPNRDLGNPGNLRSPIVAQDRLDQLSEAALRLWFR